MDIFIDLVANGFIVGEVKNKENRRIYSNKEIKLNKDKISFNIYFPYEFRKLYKDILSFYKKNYFENFYYMGINKLSKKNVIVISNLDEKRYPYKYIADTMVVSDLIEKTSDLIISLKDKLSLQEYEIIKLQLNHSNAIWSTRYTDIVKVIY